MNIKVGKAGDLSVILVNKETEEVGSYNDLFKFIKEKEIFKGNNSEIYANYNDKDKVIFLGLGDLKDLDYDGIRKASFKLGRKLIELKVESAGMEIPKFEGLCRSRTIRSFAEGLIHSEYSHDKFLSEKKLVPSVKEFYFDIEDDKAEDMIEEAQILMEGVFLARDLVNEPAMYMTPSKLAEMAVSNLEPLGVEVKVMGQKEIEEMGMVAFLAVSKGSSEEPKFIVMNWKGNEESDEKLALVGKGLTYDSGGYSLKPAGSMETMFSDMAGAASVIGTFKAIAKSKLNKNVVGIVAACENLISGGAYKPGDIISSMSGKTIEVLNTDAEGRLTLADALWYAATVEKADRIVDIATLTGACIVALGHVATGAITNDDGLMEDVKKASEKAGEPVWQLPSFKEYRDQIKSSFADLSNTGKRGAGTITAGLFLEEFVNETPWVHLDIAGTSYISSEMGYLPKGATGVPVGTLYNLVKCN